MAGSAANFVDTLGVKLTFNGIEYTQLLDITFDTDSNVTKHQLTDDTIDNVYSLRMNSIQGNMILTTTEWIGLVSTTADANGTILATDGISGSSGYTAGETAILTGGTGSSTNAAAIVTAPSGTVTALGIISGGTGYIDNEVLTITGLTSGVSTATAAVNGVDNSNVRLTSSCIVQWTDSSGSTKTTTFNGQMQTLRPIDSTGPGLVTLFFRIEADEVIGVT